VLILSSCSIWCSNVLHPHYSITCNKMLKSTSCQLDKDYCGPYYVPLVGTRDLPTLWSPPVSLHQERHTQRRKAANFIFILFIFCDENPLKSPPWKHTWWSGLSTYINIVTYFYKAYIIYVCVKYNFPLEKCFLVCFGGHLT
jgi:hypothetical protein